MHFFLGTLRVKSRVDNHIHVYKYHLALDQCLFYCTLCLFRSTENTPLQQHVYTYNRHRQEAKKIGVNDSAPFLQESPYIIGDSDYVQHNQHCFCRKISTFRVSLTSWHQLSTRLLEESSFMKNLPYLHLLAQNPQQHTLSV